MDQMYEGNFRGNRFWLELAVEGSSDREMYSCNEWCLSFSFYFFFFRVLNCEMKVKNNNVQMKKGKVE